MYANLLMLSIIIACMTVSASQTDGESFHTTMSLPLTISPIVIPQSGNTDGACPSSDIREAARQNITEDVRRLLGVVFGDTKEVPDCGEGQWRLVAFLNMTDPDQVCPGDWQEYDVPRRTCARQTSSGASCNSAYYDVTAFEYNRVCGRITGDSYTSPDGFFRYSSGGAYLDGVSVTYGTTRNHIWSFAAGHPNRCPCDNTNRNYAPLPPSFVGDNYFCDTTQVNGNLWDGEDCTNNCCTFNSPPWFSVRLPEATTDDIEMRICGDQSTGDEHVPIEYIEMYIQ